MKLNITQGKVERPQRVVIYGPEGIGKTTLASKFPKPLFIDTEDGSVHMDVMRVEKPKTFSGLISIVEEVAKSDVCQTLVLDTADWAEIICISSRLESDHKTSIEDYGFGKGYVIIGEDFQKLLAAFDKCIAVGINVVVTAHAKMRKFEQPDEAGAYDRWEMKLSKQIAPLLKEWADMVLFCNYETIVITTKDNKKKATGGKRFMFTTHHPCWDAKNRVGMEEKLPMEYESIKEYIPSVKIPKTEPEAKTESKEIDDSVRDYLKDICIAANISSEELRKVVEMKGKVAPGTLIKDYPKELIANWIVPNFERIIKAVEDERIPFTCN